MNEAQVFEVIFSPEAIEMFEQVGRQYSDDCWQIGRYTVIAVKELQRLKSEIITQNLAVPYADFILAFGVMNLYRQLAKRFGVSIRTLTSYVAVAEFYSDEQIEKYGELPFSHFAFAKRCGPDVAERVLALSLIQKDLNGYKAPSVDWLEANLDRVVGDPGLLEDLEATQEFEEVAAGMAVSDFEKDGPLPPSIYYFLHSINRLMDSLLKRVDRLDRIEPERKEKIKMMIAMIADLSAELQIDSEQVK